MRDSEDNEKPAQHSHSHYSITENLGDAMGTASCRGVQQNRGTKSADLGRGAPRLPSGTYHHSLACHMISGHLATALTLSYFSSWYYGEHVHRTQRKFRYRYSVTLGKVKAKRSSKPLSQPFAAVPLLSICCAHDEFYCLSSQITTRGSRR